MKQRSKTRLNPRFSAVFTVFLAVAAAALVLTACNSPMGLGKPIDTLPPTIVIDTPADNDFIRGILLGSPVIITGYVLDDFSGPDDLLLTFEMHNKTAGRSVEPVDIVWKIDPDGKWRAEITIAAKEGAEDYTIKVFAQDTFKNLGSALVNIRLDFVPPWVKDAYIIKHPGNGYNFRSALYSNEHYIEDGYIEEKEYRNIPYLKTDEYQNEAFTLRVEIEPAFADVAGSRLRIKSAEDTYLHEEGLAPSGSWRGEGLEAARYPEWEVTAAQLESWDPEFASGGSYILFEIWAYSEAAWDKTNDEPILSEPGRVQKINGTMWHPESDRPRATINPEMFINDIVFLEQGADAALAVDFYDDDRLGAIYMKLLPKLEFLALCGSLSEEDYLESLVDPADPRGKRASLISSLRLTDSFDAEAAGDCRFQRAEISSKGLGLGEYRLIALSRDDKSKPGYSFGGNTVPSWGVYPPVSIVVRDANAPFIFVEEPEEENIFPPLEDGEGFVMSGYMLGRMETISLNIAWVPKSLQSDGGVRAAMTVLESEGVAALKTPGESFTADNGIIVYKINLTDAAEKTVLNGIDYYKTDFKKIFHIIDDFQYNGSFQNDDKLLVLHALNHSSGAYATFSLPGLKVGPDVEVIHPQERGAGHDPNDDLLLRMKVSQGAYRAAVEPGSQVITDITNSTQDLNASFSGPTAYIEGEWTREVKSEYIMSHYQQGETRRYAFRARDILGNVTQHDREIIFTDQPLLESITCTETSGTFGIDHELTFEATFSISVRVTQSPGQLVRLKLYLVDPGLNTGVSANLKYAEYVPPTEDVATAAKTIFFKYTVQEGDTTINNGNRIINPGYLLCTSVDAIIIPNGATIKSAGGVDANLVLRVDEDEDGIKSAGGLLQNKSKIIVDGVRPAVIHASFDPYDPPDGFTYNGISYYTNGKAIMMKLHLNDTVRVIGSPAAIIRYGTTTLKAQYARKTTNGGGAIPLTDTLYFTHTFNDPTGNGHTIPLTQLEWGAPWFEFDNGDITDAVGNRITNNGTYNSTSGTSTSVTLANRQGAAGSVPIPVVGPSPTYTFTYPSERGYVKTTLPPTPGYSLHNSSNGAENNTDPSGGLGGTEVKRNANVYLRAWNRDTASNALLKYSLEGGSSPQTVSTPGTAATGTAVLVDKNANLRHLPSYERSEYRVTVWQEDPAGNRSLEAGTRQVTINSRWPELVSIEIGLPDGDYTRGENIPLRLNFSGKVQKRAGGSAMSYDVYAYYIPPGQTEATQQGGLIASPSLNLNSVTWDDYDPNGWTSVLAFNWPAVPNPNISGNLHDIKLTRITLSGNFVDEYGNTLGIYSGGAQESLSQPNRPIGISPVSYPFQLDRPKLWIYVDGPLPVSSNPIMGGNFYVPNSTGGNPFNAWTDVYQNGNVITKNGQGDYTFTLTYDVAIYKVAGKYIEIRPYGNWAIPPVLSVEEMDGLLNSINGSTTLSAATKLEYRQRLIGGGDYLAGYTETTHGLVNKGTQARPDTTTKWVLRFEFDPHSADFNVAGLRRVFEEADWKVQRIHVASQQVTVNDRTATFILGGDLEAGRIWKVTPDPGAFADAAGNPSGRGRDKDFFGYRFWSPGTATPVIRVNRVSYNARGSNNMIPNIDTEVRIDCETPGADIHFNYIRTRIELPITLGTCTEDENGLDWDWVEGSYYNHIFVCTKLNDVEFFGYDVTAENTVNNVAGSTDGDHQVREDYPEPMGSHIYYVYRHYWDGPTTGYGRNTIGNDNYTVKVNGFLPNLLVPRDVQYNGGISPLTDTVLRDNNGAPGYADITTLGYNVAHVNLWNNATMSKVYRSVAANGVGMYNSLNPSYVDSSGHFYVGESWSFFSAGSVKGRYDSKLYTGRRDYVAAAAKKMAVTSGSGDVRGPELDVSGAGYEGVYKTTVIFREPYDGNDYSWTEDAGFRELRLTGTSDIPNSTVSGFPSGNRYMYRMGNYVGGINANHPNYPQYPDGREGVPRHHITNNFLWVSWEIVSDWYLKNRNREKVPDTVHSNKEINDNNIAATYGGIVYRYGQWPYSENL